jgi:carbon-monoxide dehydrogenase medium subunit
MPYARPHTVEEAVALLAEGGVPLAGGTVLVRRVVQGAAAPPLLVDLAGITALRSVTARQGYLSLGALTTLEELAGSVERHGAFTALARAAAAVGNPNVRRAGTLGGNLGWGLPGADTVAALVVLEAEVVRAGPDGQEALSVMDFVTNGVGTAHLITGVRLPRRDGWRSDFVKFGWRRATAKSIVSVAAALQVDGGRIAAARLAVGGVTRRAPRLTGTEHLLEGRTAVGRLIDEAAASASEEASLDRPAHVGDGYRRRLVAAGVRQLLRTLMPS